MSAEHATTTLVVNPTAGRGRALKILPKVMDEFVRGLPEGSLRVMQATSFEDAGKLCREVVAAAQANAATRDSLVVMGGDGMMHLGVNACGGTNVPLGMIPAGTGNDICRGVNLPIDSVKAAKIIVEGNTMEMDLALVVGKLSHGNTHRYVGSVVATGYDARVSVRGASSSPLWGPLTYAVAALQELRNFQPVQYRIRIDGVERTLPAMFIAVSNGGKYGGGMWIAPKASITDGLLDITIVHPVSKFTLLRLLGKMFDGSFATDPAIEMTTGREVVIDGDGLVPMADGETLGEIPLGVTCAPGALTVYVPNQSPLAKRRKK
ncbi:MAG: diacylglycerol kinase family lipid kinase [Propionibacteriaceae bacterium]|jgi:diacylglycerol kinase (ATP)|nr:diacylglycerol kinase family lipid kinase [Propionibacteriaceae bacterium]